MRDGGGGDKKQIQKQCTNTYDEQETHVTVGLFNRESVGEQNVLRLRLKESGDAVWLQ